MNYYDLYLIFAGYSFKESFCNKGLCIKVTKEIITLTFTTDFSSHWDVNLYDLELSFDDCGNQSFPFFYIIFLKMNR